MLAGIQADELADAVYGRMAFLRATNRLFTLADPEGPKKLIDDTSDVAGPQARSCIDAFLTVYWAAMGKPDLAIESSGKFSWNELPDLVAQRVTAWALALAFGEAGRADEAAAAARAGYPVPIRSFVIITDAHIGARLLSAKSPMPRGRRKPSDNVKSNSEHFSLSKSVLSRWAGWRLVRGGSTRRLPC